MSSVITSGTQTAPTGTSVQAGVVTTSPHQSEGGRTVGLRATSDYATGAESRRDRKFKGFVTNRRLKGFVTEATGDTWRVIFIEKNRRVPYNLPAAKLREAGIEFVNQPFEVDELVPTALGAVGKTYVFRPLAKAEDAFHDPVLLDSNRQEKLKLILAQFGKSKA